MNPKMQAIPDTKQPGKSRHDQVMRWASRAAILTLSFAGAAAHAGGGGGGGLDGITATICTPAVAGVAASTASRPACRWWPTSWRPAAR